MQLPTSSIGHISLQKHQRERLTIFLTSVLSGSVCPIRNERGESVCVCVGGGGGGGGGVNAAEMECKNNNNNNNNTTDRSGCWALSYSLSAKKDTTFASIECFH